MKRLFTVCGLAALALFGATKSASAMPFLVPIFVAWGATLIVAEIAAFVVATVVTMAISFAASALLKPSSSGGPAGTYGGGRVGIDQKQNVKQATAPRKVVYGQTRVGGVYAFINTTDINQYLHMAIMYAGHECEQILRVWIDEKKQTLGWHEPGDGFVANGRYTGNAFFNFHLGTPDQEADAIMINGFPPQVTGNAPLWTVNHRLRGICYVYARLEWDNQARDGTLGAKVWTGNMPNITVEMKGKKCFDPRTGLVAWTQNSALIVADYLCDQVYGLGVDYATRIDEEALISAANACDEFVFRLDPENAMKKERRYTTNGVFDSDAQPDDILGRLLGAMHGRAIFDGDRWTILAGVYQTPTETIDDDDMRAGSDIQTLTSATAASNGVKGTYVGPDQGYQSADFPAVISEFFKSQDGGIPHLKDIEAPFTDSPSRAQRIAKIDLLMSRQEIVETFRGKLSVWRVRTGDTVLRNSARYGWVNKPFEVKSATFAVDTSGDEPTLGIDLVLQETDPSVYAWATDEESPVDPAPNTNFPEFFDVFPPSNVRAVEGLYLGRSGGPKAYIRVSLDPSPDFFVSRGGGYQARYRLMGATQWIYTAQTADTTIDILDVAPGIYEIQSSSVNWAGNASLFVPDPALSLSVQGLGAKPAAPQNLQFAAGGLGTFATLRFDRTADLDVQFGGQLVVRHSHLLEAASWAEGVSMSKPLDGASTHVVVPLKAGTYMLRFVNSSGNWSDMASAISRQDGSLDFFPLDEVVEGPEFAGVAQSCIVADGVLMIDGATDFNSVEDVDALASWDFSTGVMQSTSYLIGESGFAIGDPVSGFVFGRPPSPASLYSFAGVMDLGAVTPCRLTSLIESTVINVFDDFDTRSGNSDSWANWDGDASGNEADAVLFVQATPDDPADVGAVWGAWNRLDTAEFKARGFRFQLELHSYDPAFNISVAQAAVYAEAP